MTLNDEQKKLLKELVEFVKNWKSDDPEYNGLIRDKYLVEFVTDLQEKIYNDISMNGKSGQTLILYTGQSVEKGDYMYKVLPEFCTNNPDYYYITNTDAGSILWQPLFQETIKEVIVDKEIYTQILSGKYWDSELNDVGDRKGPYAIDGTTLLSLDDFISSILTQKAIENGNRVIYVAGQGWSSDSVGMQSELPTFIKEAWIGKNVDEALNTRLTIVGDLSEIKDVDSQYISDIGLYKTEFYVDADGKVTGVKLVSGLDDINVGTIDTDGTVYTYGSKLGILENDAIIAKYNLSDVLLQTDIDMYRRFDYYTSMEIGENTIKKTGILPDSDIKLKYEFLSECTDTDILNQFRNYEYIMTNEIAQATADKMSSMNIYFNSEGKIVSISDVPTGEIPAEGVYKITMNDSRNFLLDATMESMYKGYSDLNPFEKIQAKQLDYDYRKITLKLDKITISDTTMNKYLSASKKTAGELNFADRQLMKVADSWTGGKDDIAKSITAFADKCKTLGKVSSVVMNGVDIAGTIYIAASSITEAITLYNAGYETEASALMAGCAVDMVGGMAGGTALTGAISPYLVGFGAAVGGPVGATIGAVISGLIGYGTAGEIASNLGDYVRESWDDIVATLGDACIAAGEEIDDIYGGVLAFFDPDADGAYYGGSDDAETLYGGDGANKMEGFDGNDKMYGRSGSDVMYGGDDNDTIYGQSGNDTLYGESGNDTLNGGTGYDKLYGGAGNDTYIWGEGFGTDQIYDSSGLNKIIIKGIFLSV